jgi:hypothetical protein
MIEHMYYWMPEYSDDWRVYKIPEYALNLYDYAQKIKKVPTIKKQMEYNDRMWELKPIGTKD